MRTVAFDIDGTLYKVVDEGVPPEWRGALEDRAPHKFHQALDYDLIQLLRWYQKNGDRVIVWSAGGVDYARNFVNKFGLQEDGPIEVLEKKFYSPATISGVKVYGVDICYDDQIVNLAKVNILVRR